MWNTVNLFQGTLLKSNLIKQSQHFAVCVYMAVYAYCMYCMCVGECLGDKAMLYSLRHQRAEPSIYQLQLGSAPSLLPEGTVKHIFVRSTRSPRDLMSSHHVGFAALKCVL